MARRTRRSRRSRCKYGKLKNPRGRRICRARPKRRSRRGSSSAASRREAVKYERDVERDLIARHKAALGRLRRRRR